MHHGNSAFAKDVISIKLPALFGAPVWDQNAKRFWGKFLLFVHVYHEWARVTMVCITFDRSQECPQVGPLGEIDESAGCLNRSPPTNCQDAEKSCTAAL